MPRTREQVDRMDARLARIRRSHSGEYVCFYARDSETGRYEPARGKFVDPDDVLTALSPGGERREIGTVLELEAARRADFVGKWIAGPVGGLMVIFGLAGLLRDCA